MAGENARMRRAGAHTLRASERSPEHSVMKRKKKSRGETNSFPLGSIAGASDDVDYARYFLMFLASRFAFSAAFVSRYFFDWMTR